MIYGNAVVTVSGENSTIDKVIILYRGDYQVEIRFKVVSSPFRQSIVAGTGTNLLSELDISFGQMIIKIPNVDPVFSSVSPVEDGSVVFTFTKEMIDEITEVGDYDFQIRLFDENKTSRATLPPVTGGIKIKEPIAYEDGEAVETVNETNTALVNYAIMTTADALDVFDEDGNYIETTWADKMLITDARLNKIEQGITGVNQKAVSAIDNMPTATSQLTNDSDFATNASVDAKIENIDTGGGNIGVSYDEVNEEFTFIESDIVAGGLTSTAQTLLISILRNAVFTSDQSANITLLQSELAKGNSGGGSETTQYTISNSLSNATTSNSTVLVDANASYSATITVNDGYTLGSITVTMGGIDITSTVVSGTTITISSVTGDVVITVTSTATSSGGEMVTDGLVNYFDFRTAAYNNNGAGGSTIISATQGDGSLYTWANNMVTTQDDYGAIINRSMIYNGTSVGTTTTSLGTSFTVIFKSYLTGLSSPLFDNGYATLSNVQKISYRPKYKTSSGTGNVTATGLGERKSSGYETLTLIVDGDICKLYFGTELMQTNDGSTIDDFQGWYDKLEGIQVLGGNGYFTQIAIYNKALSEVELVDMLDYLTTLEVSS